MANCPKCRRILYASQEKCQCGYVIPKAVPNELACHHPSCPDPGSMRTPGGNWFCNRHYHEFMHLAYTPKGLSPVQAKFNQRLKEVDIHITEYRKSHAGATKRMACLDYLHGKGVNVKKLFDDPEAKAEREAIQNE